MKKHFSVAVLLLLMLALSTTINAQPNPPGPPGSTTSVPLDPAAMLFLAGAAALKWMKEKRAVEEIKQP